MGKFTVTNEWGDVCEMEMIPSNVEKRGSLRGDIKDVNGNVKIVFDGNWDDKIDIIMKDTGEKIHLWDKIESLGKENYYLQPFSVDMNYLTEEMKNVLPHTDSRFRPDQRFMEYQELDKAADEKHRLEEEQRARAKKYKADGFIPRPLFFEETYDDLSGELIYKYKGNYWDMRNKRDYKDLPKIF